MNRIVNLEKLFENREPGEMVEYFAVTGIGTPRRELINEDGGTLHETICGRSGNQREENGQGI